VRPSPAVRLSAAMLQASEAIQGLHTYEATGFHGL